MTRKYQPTDPNVSKQPRINRNRLRRWFFGRDRVLKKRLVMFTKNEPGWSRRLKLRGANGGKNVSRLKTKRRISGRIRGGKA